MNTRERSRIGYYGESAACFYLKNKGFSILARNLRLSCDVIRGEIDILALKDRVLHVVEVKSVCIRGSQSAIFAPESNLSQAKIRKLHKLRSILIMRMFEGEPLLGEESLIGKAIPPISKVVITGVAVTLYVNMSWRDSPVAVADIANNVTREQIQRIKVRFFDNL